MIERRIAEWLYIAVAFTVDCRTVLLKLFVRRAGKIPQGQKHSRQVPNGVSAQQHARILPMAVLFVRVDIFVRDVDPAAEADIAVNHSDLAVIAIIHGRIQMRVEHRALNARVAQLNVVIDRQRHNGAEVVVHKSDLNPLGRLLLENLKDRFPHFAFLKDKIFHEDKAFGLWQLLAQARPHGFTDRQILRLRVFPHWRSGCPRDIIGNQPKLRIVCDQLAGAWLVRRRDTVLALFRLPNAVHQLFRHALVAEHQIKDSPEQRKQHDRDDPGKFI